VLLTPATETTGFLSNWKIWAKGIYVDGSIYSIGSIISKNTISMVDEYTDGKPGLVAT
jgi:hypothetical protein